MREADETAKIFDFGKVKTLAVDSEEKCILASGDMMLLLGHIGFSLKLFLEKRRVADHQVNTLCFSNGIDYDMLFLVLLEWLLLLILNQS